MRRQDQIAKARKLLSHIDTRTTALADSVYRNPVTDYTCPRQAARERQLFFEDGPINIGLSALLPRPGDWMTHDYAGAPILLARREDGSLAAFLNVCRHRGARIAEGCGSQARSFSCPYHGWTYDLDGALIARPEEVSFPSVDRATHGLRALPAVEKNGMIWVGTRPGIALNIDRQLAGLADDLASYNLKSYHHYETRTLTREMNWKLAVDTFGETYHLQLPASRHDQPAFLQQPRDLRRVWPQSPHDRGAAHDRRTARPAGSGVGRLLPHRDRSTCCFRIRYSSSSATMSKAGTFSRATGPTAARCMSRSTFPTR